MTNEERAAMWAAKIADKFKKAGGKGLAKAVAMGELIVKQEASVKAPTRWVQPRDGRPKYPVATVAATPGAPLRVVSGRFRQSITHQMESEFSGLIGSDARAPDRGIAHLVVSFHGVRHVGGKFNYPAYHEVPNYEGYKGAGQHKTFAPALLRHINDFANVIGGEVRVELG
jgi:hypothetical protein